MSRNENQIIDSMGMDDLLLNEAIETNDSFGNNSSSSSSGSSPTPDLDYTKIGVLGAIIVLTIIGNFLVIFAIIIRNMKLTRMYYFILHLSTADLLTAFLTLLPEFCWTFTFPEFYGGVVLCKIIKFGQMIGPYLSSYVLIMTAIDRYQAICFPLSNCTWTPRRSNVMIGIAWLISLSLCVPQVFIFGDENCIASFPPKWGVKAYVTWFAVSNFFIPLVVLLYCYGRICYVIWDNFNMKNGNDNEDFEEGCWKKAERRFRVFRECVKRKPKVRYRWRSKRYTSKYITDNEEDDDEDEDDSNSELGGGGGGKKNTRITIEPPSNSSNRGGEAVTSFTTTVVVSPSSPTKPAATTTTIAAQTANKSTITGSSGDSPDSTIIQSRTGRRINPRSHSIKGISRAKIETVKLTVVVIMGYILCSGPFICVQLWSVYGYPSASLLMNMRWLFWLLTLNSVVNPWIYMFFNSNLVEVLYRSCCSCCDENPLPCAGSNPGGPGSGSRRRRQKKSSTNTTTAFLSTANTCNNTYLTMTTTTIRSRSNTEGSNGSYSVLTPHNHPHHHHNHNHQQLQAMEMIQPTR